LLNKRFNSYFFLSPATLINENTSNYKLNSLLLTFAA
jgi:hypothetical protein